jgi:hypothetical protein
MENPRPIQQQSSHSSAFQATLQQRDQDGNKTGTGNFDRKLKGNKREKREDLDCPCGLHKNIEKCSYIFPSLRNPGWTEDPEIRRKIDLKIESNNRLAKLVEHLQREANKRGKKPELPDSSTISVRDKAAFTMSTIATGFIGSTQSSAYDLYRSFIADNGADTHLVNQVYRDRIINFRPAGPDQHVRSGPNLSPIVGIGDAWFLARDKRGELGRFWLKDVIFVPDFPTNLVSLTRAKAGGIGFDTYKEELYNARTGEVLATTQYLYNQDVFAYHELEDDDLERPCYDTPDPDPTAFAAARRNTTPTSMMSPHSAGTLQLWRQRFGYANDQTIRHLPDVARGVEITDFKTSRLPRGEPKPLDEAYELANPKQQISRRRPDPPTPNDPPFARLDIDIIQETTPGYNGDRYIFHYLCSRINFHIVTTARQKLELPADIQYQVEFIKLQWGFEVKVIHVDGETTLGTAFDDWVREKRIKYHESAPYAKEQHGRIERAGGILSSIQRTLRIDTRLPENMHPELWRTAAYLANRLPTVFLDGKSPWQALNEALGLHEDAAKPHIGHIKALGSRVYVKSNKVPRGRKSLERAHIGYLTGYDASNIFRVWIPHLKRVIRARDVRIDETKRYDSSNPHISSDLVQEVQDLILTLDIPMAPQSRFSDEFTDQFATDFTNFKSRDAPPEHTAGLSPTSPENPVQEQSTEHGTTSQKDMEQATVLPTPATTPDPDFFAVDPAYLLQIDLFDPKSPVAALPVPRQSETTAISQPRISPVSADILPEHILEGKRDRRPFDRRAVFFTEATRDPYVVFHAAYNSVIPSPRRRHRSELPPLPKSYTALHPEREHFLKICELELQKLYESG